MTIIKRVVVVDFLMATVTSVRCKCVGSDEGLRIFCGPNALLTLYSFAVRDGGRQLSYHHDLRSACK